MLDGPNGQTQILIMAMGVMLGLLKLLDIMITKQIKGKSVLTNEEHGWMKELYELHMVKDKDGVPRWYVPRSWSDDQKEIVRTQQQIAIVLDKILTRLEAHGRFSD